jgi:hypothetical protein
LGPSYGQGHGVALDHSATPSITSFNPALPRLVGLLGLVSTHQRSLWPILSIFYSIGLDRVYVFLSWLYPDATKCGLQTHTDGAPSVWPISFVAPSLLHRIMTPFVLSEHNFPKNGSGHVFVMSIEQWLLNVSTGVGTSTHHLPNYCL